MNLRTTLLATALCLFAAGAIAGDRVSARPAMDLFNEACRSASTELAARSGLTPQAAALVRFADRKTESLRAPLMDVLTAACRTVYVSGTSADTVVTVGVEGAEITYGPAFREGWFRERKTERCVRLGIRMEVVSTSSGRVLGAQTVHRSLCDTIAVDEIAETGASAQPLAVGAPPEPSLWERILEPAILTVSSGIAVYLFFTVRS